MIGYLLRIFADLDRTDGNGRVWLDHERSKRDIDACGEFLLPGTTIQVYDDTLEEPVQGAAVLERDLSEGAWFAVVRWDSMHPIP